MSDHSRMVHYRPIIVPFEGNHPLVIDPVAKDSDLSREFAWLVRDFETCQTPAGGYGYDYEAGMARIFTATAILIDAHAGTVAECLHTAIIWERG